MLLQRRDVIGLVPQCPLSSHRWSLAGKELVGKILAPQRRVLSPGLGQRAVEVEHADQPRPGARPVGHGQDRALVGQQAGQHVMRVLPDRLGHDQAGLGIDLPEDLHPFLLRADEAVLLVRLVGMRPHQFVAGLGHGARQLGLHLLLGRPALLIGRQPQVAAGDQQDLLLLTLIGLVMVGNWYSAMRSLSQVSVRCGDRKCLERAASFSTLSCSCSVGQYFHLSPTHVLVSV